MTRGLGPASSHAARIAVRVHAGARREELTVRDGIVIARVTAPALEGRANRSVCRLLAKRIGIAPSRVRIVAGVHSREKLIELEGVAAAEVQAALARPAQAKPRIDGGSAGRQNYGGCAGLPRP